MDKSSLIVLSGCLALTACASDSPRIIQATSDMQELRLTGGMATQIEMPAAEHVQSATVGNPRLLTADRVDNVVNLVPREGSGETNLIVRAVDEDGHAKIYQYRVDVQGR